MRISSSVLNDGDCPWLQVPSESNAITNDGVLLGADIRMNLGVQERPIVWGGGDRH